MKKSLSIVTLIAAGATAVMADVANISTFGGGFSDLLNTGTHSYQPQQSVSAILSNGAWKNGFSVAGSGAGITNYRENFSINLGTDARYEFKFDFTTSGGAGTDAQPIFNFYLGGNKSLSFGNYYMNYEYGSARIYVYNENISNGSTHDTSPDYILNNGSMVNNVYWHYSAPSDKYVTLDRSSFADGYHTYRLTIESYENGEDVIYLYHEVNGQEQQRSVNLSILGIDENATFNTAGFLTYADRGSALTPQAARAHSYTRTAIPEPSTFGLLAGLGALCLVGARRRRR